MAPFSDFFTNERLRFLSLRILFTATALLIYLLIWRPVRVAITEYAVYPQVKYMETEGANFSSSLESGALLLYYKFGDETKQLQYRPEFGFFFLIALITLFFVTKRKKPYSMLAALHLTGSVLAYLFLMMGTVCIQTGFILTDIISGYLIPALSLALVPLVIQKQRGEF